MKSISATHHACGGNIPARRECTPIGVTHTSPARVPFSLCSSSASPWDDIVSRALSGRNSDLPTRSTVSTEFHFSQFRSTDTGLKYCKWNFIKTKEKKIKTGKWALIYPSVTFIYSMKVTYRVSEGYIKGMKGQVAPRFISSTLSLSRSLGMFIEW